MTNYSIYFPLLPNTVIDEKNMSFLVHKDIEDQPRFCVGWVWVQLDYVRVNLNSGWTKMDTKFMSCQN